MDALGSFWKSITVSSLDNVVDTLGPRANFAMREMLRGEVGTLLESLRGVQGDRAAVRQSLIDACNKKCEDGKILLGKGRNTTPMNDEQKRVFKLMFKRIVVALDQLHHQNGGTVTLEGNPDDKVRFYLAIENNSVILFNANKTGGSARTLMTVEREFVVSPPDIESESSSDSGYYDRPAGNSNSEYEAESGTTTVTQTTVHHSYVPQPHPPQPHPPQPHPLQTAYPAPGAVGNYPGPSAYPANMVHTLHPEPSYATHLGQQELVLQQQMVQQQILQQQALQQQLLQQLASQSVLQAPPVHSGFNQAPVQPYATTYQQPSVHMMQSQTVFERPFQAPTVHSGFDQSPEHLVQSQFVVEQPPELQVNSTTRREIGSKIAQLLLTSKVTTPKRTEYIDSMYISSYGLFQGDPTREEQINFLVAQYKELMDGRKPLRYSGAEFFQLNTQINATITDLASALQH